MYLSTYISVFAVVVGSAPSPSELSAGDCACGSDSSTSRVLILIWQMLSVCVCWAHGGTVSGVDRLRWGGWWVGWTLVGWLLGGWTLEEWSVEWIDFGGMVSGVDGLR